jgi:23S rRNA (uracil1939-C5)-methyltransferase
MKQPLRPGCVEDCPACPHRSWTQEESTLQKHKWVLSSMREFAPYVYPVNSVEGASRWNYRTKVCLAAEHNGQTWNIGVRKRDKVIPIHDCPVHNERINRNINLLSIVLPGPEKNPLAYFMQSGKQLTLVLKCRELPGLDWLTDHVKNEFLDNGVEGFWLHLFPSTGKKVTGKGGWYLIFGEPRSSTDTGLFYGPSSFQQVLPVLYNNSLQEASEFLDPGKATMIIDLYSGIGASLKYWISKEAETVGVELGGEAIEYAVVNAPTARLFRGTCAKRIPQINNIAAEAKERRKELLVYANPPRTGLEKEVAEWIAKKLKPGKMSYLSCSAGTLYRDLKLIAEHGYSIEKIIPYDFFPQTRHVEMLALIRNPHS